MHAIVAVQLGLRQVWCREAQLKALHEGFVEAQEAIGLQHHMSLLSYSVGGIRGTLQ